MMIIIKSNPTSPGTRHLIKNVNHNLYKGRPEKKLVKTKKKTGGRNNQGRITTRHIGGGHKKKIRLIDFKRNKYDIPAIVKRIEYDPNRTSFIALLLYKDGEKRYIICPKGLEIGDTVLSSNNNIPIKIGNCLPLYLIPLGSLIHNIELKIGKGGQLIRSAGSSAQILSKEKKYVIIRLRSGEIRKIHFYCKATLGIVSNSDHLLITYGKAGRKRWLGIRPTVRGTAMNPIDHPHGGGEGKNFGKHPVSPWGKDTKGHKTRNNKISEKFIIHHCNK